MRTLKKLSLEKEVIERISDNEMLFLKGGMKLNTPTCDPLPFTKSNISWCTPEPATERETCGTAWTCNG